MTEKIFGLLGRKLGHSYSVPIHNKLGNGKYKLYELEPEQLGEFIRREDIGGLNVTIPYKVDAMKFCDTISPEAMQIGSVNTIVRRSGKIFGYNTDKFGFCHMLEKGGIDVKGKKVLVLGSGGASKTACFCVKELGAKSLFIISRSGEDNYENIEKHFDADIIINTTPVGMFPNNGQSAIDLKNFKNCVGVADMIYNPLRTRLLLDAEELGIKNIGGLSMLVAQAKMAAEYFFDKEISNDITDKITAEMAKESENIVLIGMPGSGKTTVGKELARLTGREILETDEMIVKAAGKSIPQIFADDGESVFRSIESEILEQAGKQSGKIIVTGGGAVTVEKNYAYLKQNGRIYEIMRDLTLLATDGRPLSKGKDLSEMYKKRRPMYDAFRDTFVENSDTAKNTAEKIWSDFCENSRD